MPLLTIPPVEIIIDIPVIEIGELSFNRTAKLFTMIYNQAAKSLTLSWIVSYTGIEGVKGISSYSKESVADNTTIVDMATGAILLPIVDENNEPVLDEEGKPTYPGNYIGQYDWFNYIAENQELHVHDLIRAYGMQADWD